MNNLSHNLTKPIPTKIVRPNLEYSVYTESHVGMFPPMPEVKKNSPWNRAISCLPTGPVRLSLEFVGMI